MLVGLNKTSGSDVMTCGSDVSFMVCYVMLDSVHFVILFRVAKLLFRGV